MKLEDLVTPPLVAPCWRLGVTVGAKYPEILQAVVGVVAVDVVELKGDRLATPICKTTFLTARALHSLPDQSSPEGPGAHRWGVSDEDLLEGALHKPSSRSRYSPSPTLPFEVTRIDTEPTNVGGEPSVDPTIRLVAKLARHLSQRDRIVDNIVEFAVRPPPMPSYPPLNHERVTRHI